MWCECQSQVINSNNDNRCNKAPKTSSNQWDMPSNSTIKWKDRLMFNSKQATSLTIQASTINHSQPQTISLAIQVEWAGREHQSHHKVRQVNSQTTISPSTISISQDTNRIHNSTSQTATNLIDSSLLISYLLFLLRNNLLVHSISSLSCLLFFYPASVKRVC